MIAFLPIAFNINRFIIRILLVGIIIQVSGILHAQTHRNWSYNLTMYEVNVRQYSEAGTFEAVEADLDRLEDLGVGILWLMPIHPIGEVNRLGSLGSYYSVKDYLGINPEFGTKEEFKSLVDAAHDRGMYVLMDWVPNHTSWDNVLTESNPEWYLQENGNFISPPGTNWTDAIQLDHSQDGLRDYMVDAMRYWVDSLGVDGFRFDAASFVPASFWSDVLPRVRESKSDLFLLAESEGPIYHQLGFDSSFGWSFYGFGGGVLSSLINGTASSTTLGTFLVNEGRRYGRDAYRLYFTSNHDENSWEGTTEERFGDRAEVFAVLSATVHGMPLIYNGQEAGLDKRLAFFEKDEIPWQEHPNFELYEALIDLRKRNKALWAGKVENFHRRIYTNPLDEVFAFMREVENERVVVVTNLSRQPKNIQLNGDFFAGSYIDIFLAERVELEGNDAINLPAGGYVVLEKENAATSLISDQLPLETGLHGAYPNPFNPSTTIRYSIGQAAFTELSLYNLNGQKVQSIEDSFKAAGVYEVRLNASNLSSGMYLLHMSTDSKVFTQKISLIK